MRLAQCKSSVLNQRCKLDLPVLNKSAVYRSSSARSSSIFVRAGAESAVPLPHTPAESRLEGSSNSSHVSGLAKRIMAGLFMGAVGAMAVIHGGWLYLIFIELFVYQAAQEYFGFIASVDKREGFAGIPGWSSTLVTCCCMAMPLYSFISGGKIAIPLALSSFVLLSALGVGSRRPRMTTLSGCMFGLLYCGYLPTFWLKLRILAAPLLQSPLAHAWPVALGGISHMTVGLLATFAAAACTVASDVGAYAVGKMFGKTPLSRISPGKTVEGALGGFLSSIATAMLISGVTAWPLPGVAALGLGVVVSFAAMLGDLVESAMKRDAGMKDSGGLIPGHGGILDRFDSYIFTGAVVYVYVQILPLMGI